MGIFSKVLGRESSEYVLALDIGTEIVKALIFRIEGGIRGVVSGVGWVRQKSGNMQSGAVSDIGGVIESCREAILLAEEQAGIKKVRKSIIGIAGELVKGTTTTVHYDGDAGGVHPCFFGGYFLDGTTACDPVVTMGFDDDTRPVVLSGDSFMYLVMPHHRMED